MAYSIDYINTICTDLGGSGGHEYEIDGLNEICTLLSATAGHTYSIDALNAICTALGYTAGWRYEIEALNAICTGGGGTGGHQYEIHAWQEIQTGSLLNQNEPEADALIVRMIALGETPSAKYAENINTTIKSLKENCLFDRRFDCLYIGKGYGEASTKLNWIKDAHNLTKEGAGTLTFTDAVGYKSDGFSTCLSTNYNPRTHGVNYTKSDASAILKLSGTLGGATRIYCGAQGADYASDLLFSTNYGGARMAINNSLVAGDGQLIISGYNSLVRINNTTFKQYVNDSEFIITRNASNNPNNVLNILAGNNPTGSPFYFAPNTTIFEFAAFGGYISLAENLTLQSIINTFISKL